MYRPRPCDDEPKCCRIQKLRQIRVRILTRFGDKVDGMRLPDCKLNCRQVLSLSLALSGCILLISPLMPLGVPDEWVWTRHALPSSPIEWLDRLVLPLTGAAALLVVVQLGHHLLRRPAFGRTAMALICLAASTVFWHWAVQQSAPSPHRELKPLWILYDKYASGYFFEAAFHTTSVQELLQNYESRMREGDVLHVGTHPPGLFLLSHAALKLTDSCPGLVKLLESVRSRPSEQLFRDLEGNARFERPMTRSQLAALQFVSILGRGAAAFTVVPIFFLAAALAGQQRMPDVATGWRAASLYATIPVISIFMPRSDVIYPLTATAFLALACLALQSSVFWRQTSLAIGGAMILFLGLLLSLAHLPAVIVLLGFVFLRNLNSNRQQRMIQVRILLSGLITFVACVAVWYLVTDCNLAAIWKLNLTNHAGFYDQSPRTWWMWLWVNPLELAFAVGWPLFIVSVLHWKSAVAHAASAMIRQLNVNSDGIAFLASSAVTWTALWLSGKNMGEAARLWCFLTPWLAIAAAMPTTSTTAPNSPTAGSDSGWRIILLVQILTAIITVGRVNGYSL